MMKNFSKTPLDYDKTKSFFLKTLEEGHVLAHELLNTLCFKEGLFFAITSNSVDVSKLKEFRYAGIFPANPLKNKSSVQKRKTSIAELATFLTQLLEKNANQLCVFEDVAFKKDDPCLDKIQSKIKYFQNNVYYFLSSSNNSEETLLSFIKLADAQWYYMNIVTQAPILPKNQQLEAKDIKMLAKNTTHLILGAYDGEGYVCWERANPSELE